MAINNSICENIDSRYMY